jgi:hypothetical protein
MKNNTQTEPTISLCEYCFAMTKTIKKDGKSWCGKCGLLKPMQPKSETMQKDVKVGKDHIASGGKMVEPKESSWEERFDASFNYVAPCLKGNCHQGAHIYDELGNCCELKDIKDFIRLQRLEAQRQERERIVGIIKDKRLELSWAANVTKVLEELLTAISQLEPGEE